MVTVETYSSYDQAMSAQSWLGANGIDSTIPDSNTVSILPHVATYSGIRLQVDESDLEKALELLKENKKNHSINPDNPGLPLQMSRSAARKLFGFQLGLQLLLCFWEHAFPITSPEEIESFVSNQYLSYRAALFTHDLYYPTLLLSLVSMTGLCFFKKWARNLYTALWLISVLMSPFYQASISYGMINLLWTIQYLLGGFILCLLYFSPLLEKPKP